jgi:hypothetical protein
MQVHEGERCDRTTCRGFGIVSLPVDSNRNKLDELSNTAQLIYVELVYVFKPDQGRFVPIREISGVSKHLILDRPQAFAGEGVKVLVVGLTLEQIKGTKVNLTNSEGKVVASTSNQEQTPVEQTNVWLPFPRDLAPGNYTVQLIQQGGNQPKVIDRTSVVVSNSQA